MHMAWLRHIGGRLKSDYRYSIGLVYNTFPMPLKGADLSRLEPLAQAVLNSPLKKASLTGFHATAKHIAAKAVSPSSETMRTL